MSRRRSHWQAATAAPTYMVSKSLTVCILSLLE